MVLVSRFPAREPPSESGVPGGRVAPVVTIVVSARFSGATGFTPAVSPLPYGLALRTSALAEGRSLSVAFIAVSAGASVDRLAVTLAAGVHVAYDGTAPAPL